MEHDELLALLTRAREVLDHYLVDEESESELLRDDVAQICMAIDDALPNADRTPIKHPKALARVAGDVAA